MIFIGFLLDKSYENLLFTKKQCIYNQVLMCIFNMCKKSKICIFLKRREY